LNKRFGVTLVELIISVVIISIAFYALISVFSQVATSSVDTQTYLTVKWLAEGKMEEAQERYKNRDPYDGTVVVDWTCFDNDGSDPDIPLPATDLLNYPGRFAEYFYKITMEYINKNSEPITVKALSDTPPPTVMDMRKLTVEVAKKNSFGNILYGKALSTILPARFKP